MSSVAEVYVAARVAVKCFHGHVQETDSGRYHVC